VEDVLPWLTLRQLRGLGDTLQHILLCAAADGIFRLRHVGDLPEHADGCQIHVDLFREVSGFTHLRAE